MTWWFSACHRSPSKHYIKRLVGLPGDRIVYRDKQLVINGEPVSVEAGGCCASAMDAMPAWASSAWVSAEHEILVLPQRRELPREFVVPEGRYFMMGDNRDNSKDSRYPDVGMVPERKYGGQSSTYLADLAAGLEPGRQPNRLTQEISICRTRESGMTAIGMVIALAIRRAVSACRSATGARLSRAHEGQIGDGESCERTRVAKSRPLPEVKNALAKRYNVEGITHPRIRGYQDRQGRIGHSHRVAKYDHVVPYLGNISFLVAFDDYMDIPR